MSQRTAFAPDEWQTLQLGPFWVFSALSGSYRDFDPLELELFAASLDAAADDAGELGREVLTSVTADLGGLREQYHADGRTIAAWLCGIADVLAGTPSAEARTFKQMLISSLGVRIAKGRGPFGRPATVEDMQQLRIVVQLLAGNPVLIDSGAA